MYKKVCVRWIFPLLVLWLTTQPAWALMVCLQHRGIKFASCESCIDTILEGVLKLERRPYLYTKPNENQNNSTYTNIDPNDTKSFIRSNVNDGFIITSEMTKRNSPIWATSGTVTLRAGTEISFDDCTIDNMDKLKGEQRTLHWVSASTGANDIPYTIYKEAWSPKTYGCTQQQATGVPWKYEGAKTLVDGLALEFRCNIVTIIDRLSQYAKRMFVVLFLIDNAWTYAALVIGGGRDLQNFLKVIIRKTFFYGFFWWLLNLTSPGTNFFEDGSWVGQTIMAIERIGIDIITGENGTEPPIFKTIQMDPSANVTDMQKYVDDGSLFIKVNPNSAGQLSKDPRDPIIGMSPARITLYGFNLMGAILSAFGQTILVNFPGILAAAFAIWLIDATLMSYVMKIFVILTFVVFCVAFMTLITMIALGGQIFIAMIEMYMICGLGFLFLGFGGSRWTVDTVAKYMGYVLVTGLKLLMMIVIMIVTIFMVDGWIHRILALAGGGINQSSKADNAAAIFSGFDPVQMVIRTFEALLVYLSILMEALILYVVSMRSPSFLLGMIGGSPLMSSGQVTQVSLAGLQAASHMTTALVGAAGHLDNAVKNTGGQIAAVPASFLNSLKNSFNEGAGLPQIPSSLPPPGTTPGAPPRTAAVTGAAPHGIRGFFGRGGTQLAAGPNGKAPLAPPTPGRFSRAGIAGALTGAGKDKKSFGNKFATGLGGISKGVGALALPLVFIGKLGNTPGGIGSALDSATKPRSDKKAVALGEKLAIAPLRKFMKEKGKKYAEDFPEEAAAKAATATQKAIAKGTGGAQGGNNAGVSNPSQKNSSLKKTFKIALSTNISCGIYPVLRSKQGKAIGSGLNKGWGAMKNAYLGKLSPNPDPSKIPTRSGGLKNGLSTVIGTPGALIAGGAMGIIGAINPLGSAKDSASEAFRRQLAKSKHESGFFLKSKFKKSLAAKKKAGEQNMNDYAGDIKSSWGRQETSIKTKVGDLKGVYTMGKPKDPNDPDTQLYALKMKGADKNDPNKYSFTVLKANHGGTTIYNEADNDGNAKKNGRQFIVKGTGNNQTLHEVTNEVGAEQMYQHLARTVGGAIDTYGYKGAVPGAIKEARRKYGIGTAMLLGGSMVGVAAFQGAFGALGSASDIALNLTSERGELEKMQKRLDNFAKTVGGMGQVSLSPNFEGVKWPAAIGWANDE